MSSDPVVETITREVVKPVAEEIIVSSPVQNEVVMDVASVVPTYREQVVVSPSNSFFMMSDPEMLSYVNVPQMQFYNPRVLTAVRPANLVIEEPMRVVKENVVDTIQSRMLGGRMTESVVSRVF